MEWGTIEHIVTLAREVVLISVAVIGAIVGILGLRTWRRQLKGQSEYELARRYLRAIYDYRDALNSARNSFISTGEMLAAWIEAGYEEKEFSPLDDSGRSDGAVYTRRWKDVVAAFTKLHVEVIEAEVLWGKKAHECYMPLDTCARQYYSAMQQYVHYKAGRRKYDNDKIFKIESIIWSGADEEGVYEKSIEDAVAAVEAWLKPKLKQ